MPPFFSSARDSKPIAWALLGAALAAAAVLLLWEGRGLTLFVDEWFFGYGARGGWSPGELLEAENGHLVLLPVLITKTSLELFGAGTALPLRLVSVGLHLTTALLLFCLLRRLVGDLVALAPTILILFFGAAADLLVGSHGMPMLLATCSGLGAWLALGRNSRGGDLAAALLLCLGLASNGLALLFVAASIAIVLLGPGDRRRRLWVPALPLALYLLWRVSFGGDGDNGFAIANLAASPGFAFDSLGAELGAVTGLFTVSGTRVQGIDPGPGLTLAGALLVAITGLYLSGWRPPRGAYPAAAALLALWVLTAAVASPARQPESARYLYPGAILLFLVAAAAIDASPFRRRGGFVLVAVCAVGLLPNLREIHYGADFFREQSDQDRAVLAAADRLGADADAALPLEFDGDPLGVGVADMTFDLGAYRRARQAYGSPALSAPELESARPSAQEAAARLRARARDD